MRRVSRGRLFFGAATLFAALVEQSTLERAATECEQSEAYRGSVFAQRIRALKPSQDQANTLEAEDGQ